MATKNKNGYPQGVGKTQTLDFPENQAFQNLLGDSDRNINIIERELDVKIGRSPSGLIISGQDTEVELASDLLLQLYSLLERGERFFPGDIERAIKMLSGNKKLRLEELFREQLEVAGKRTSIIPKTFKQKLYIEAVKTHDMVISVGPAGTGKTYLAMAMAISSLLKKNVKRVVLCRPAVEAGEKLGFLPGDMAEKVNPYLRPLYDALYDMVDFEKAKELMERGQIEVAPLAFMRGRTLSNAFVILDEAQNTTSMQMKMFLTRLGFGSKCVVTGDITQVDLPRGTLSGLVEVLDILRDIKEIGIIRFTEEDVVRHPLVSEIVAAYEKSSSESK